MRINWRCNAPCHVRGGASGSVQRTARFADERAAIRETLGELRATLWTAGGGGARTDTATALAKGKAVVACGMRGTVTEVAPACGVGSTSGGGGWSVTDGGASIAADAWRTEGGVMISATGGGPATGRGTEGAVAEAGTGAGSGRAAMGRRMSSGADVRGEGVAAKRTLSDWIGRFATAARSCASGGGAGDVGALPAADRVGEAAAARLRSMCCLAVQSVCRLEPIAAIAMRLARAVGTQMRSIQ